jgi:predicted acetyltransferase
MQKFRIIKNELNVYKQQIFEFWRKYLPGTPKGRFEWMQNNPAGPPDWSFAVEEKSGELAGIVSIMPKRVFINGKTIIKAGIVGDFMVSSRYRVFGPFLQLQNTVVENYSNLGYQFIYTIPNKDTIKIIQRAGYKPIGVLYNMAKPIKVKYYLKRHILSPPSELFVPFIQLCLKIISRETYSLTDGLIEEEHSIDESFDVFWEKIKSNKPCIISDRSSEYIKWRYFQNPTYKFRLLAYRETPGGELRGYIFFTIDCNKMEVFDIIALQRGHVYRLLKRLVGIAKEENCQAIYIQINHANSLLKLLRSCRFFNAKNDFVVFCPKNEAYLESWSFFSGDRNI